ncbi:MAG TPA: hypothetical protein ENI68_09920, partial [Gammaproteobacteria bacterium]|nr:hypothetical protein [Gammaproteobacteria bacterium]
PFEFQSSKSLLAFAGRDIVDTGFRIQNVNPNDVSVIAAGRDIFYPDSRGPTGSIRPNTRLIEVSGPGRLDLLAGRNINLGSMQGLLSVGNQGIPPGIPGNPALADVGASLSLFAGLSQEPDYGGFIDTFFAGVPKYDVELRNYVERLTGDKLQSDAALQRFRGLPRRLQRELIVSVLLGEIREAGAKAAGSGLFEDYLPAYAAINTLFPGHVDVDADLKTATPTDKWQGDVQLFFSTIRTVDEGDINIFAPGGSVNVGLAVTTNSTKDPSQLGIVAQKLGDVSAVVRDNFLVNQSRVFALDGGDITLWTSTSNIDAGRGAKTAVSAPAPVTTTDADGNVTTVFSPATAGSGIQTAVSTPGRDAGAGFLFAPVGVVDFSDAGASFAGSLVVGAGQVLNQLNVDVAGPTVGVPAVDTASVAAGLTGVSSLASTTSKLAEQSATGMGETDAAALETKASLLLIEVLGLGDSEDREKREGLGDSEDRKKRK